MGELQGEGSSLCNDTKEADFLGVASSFCFRETLDETTEMTEKCGVNKGLGPFLPDKWFLFLFALTPMLFRP